MSKTGRRGREEAQTTADLGAINVEVDFDALNVILPISLAGFGTIGIVPSEFETHDGSRSAASSRTYEIDRTAGFQNALHLYTAMAQTAMLLHMHYFSLSSPYLSCQWPEERSLFGSPSFEKARDLG